MRLYTGLVHYPVYNKNSEIITSAITTVDLHDIARLSRTYGVEIFFVITPLEEQQKLAEQILSHWTKGFGARYNQYRKQAIELIQVVSSLEDAIAAVTEIENETPILISTGANKQGSGEITFKDVRTIIEENKAILIVFGTAWGLEKSVIKRSDYTLEPIPGRFNYNHLSVRSAAAIILDRLVGIG